MTAGADAVRVGTRFIAANESNAHPAYVAALIGATGEGHGDHHGVWRWLARRAAPRAQVFDRGGPQTRGGTFVESRLATVQLHRPGRGPCALRGQSVGGIRSRQSATGIVAELVEEAADSGGPLALAGQENRSARGSAYLAARGPTIAVIST